MPKIVYSIETLKQLRHEAKDSIAQSIAQETIEISQIPLSPAAPPSNTFQERQAFLDPLMFPKGSKIVKLKPGDVLPPGAIRLPFPIDTGHSLKRWNSVPPVGNRGYYANFSKVPIHLDNHFEADSALINTHSGDMRLDYQELSESSSESIQIQLPKE